MKKVILVFTVLALTFANVASSIAEDDVAALRRQLAEQRELIKTQQQQLDRQAQTLDQMNQRLDELAAGKSGEAKSGIQLSSDKITDKGMQNPEKDSPGSSVPNKERTIFRDVVGDLNAAAVRKGEFPGSFKIPGGSDVSLAIGGFVKTVAISDSDAETMGATFLPSSLGTNRSDTHGGFSLDSTLTRLFLDGRAPLDEGSVRGYVEGDLNSSNNGSLGVKMRHAYGVWDTSYGSLTAGHTWSTMMDLKILPEGLTEPTVSGVFFMRQPVLRWSQHLSDDFNLHIGLEDPSSSDISSSQTIFGDTSIPDVIAGVEYSPSDEWHLRLNGMVRRISAVIPGAGEDEATAWGLGLTGHWNVFQRDKLVFSGLYGEGLGRYLLGIQSTAGSVLTPVNNDLVLRDNYGGMIAYLHHWNASLRSTAMAGAAFSDSLDWQPGNTFENSIYGSVNLMWSIKPFITLGVEYAYGSLENKDGSDLGNHRMAVGIQVY